MRAKLGRLVAVELHSFKAPGFPKSAEFVHSGIHHHSHPKDPPRKGVYPLTIFLEDDAPLRTGIEIESQRVRSLGHSHFGIHQAGDAADFDSHWIAGIEKVHSRRTSSSGISRTS